MSRDTNGSSAAVKQHSLVNGRLRQESEHSHADGASHSFFYKDAGLLRASVKRNKEPCAGWSFCLVAKRGSRLSRTCLKLQPRCSPTPACCSVVSLVRAVSAGPPRAQQQHPCRGRARLAEGNASEAVRHVLAPVCQKSKHRSSSSGRRRGLCRHPLGPTPLSGWRCRCRNTSRAFRWAC